MLFSAQEQEAGDGHCGARPGSSRRGQTQPEKAVPTLGNPSCSHTWDGPPRHRLAQQGTSSARVPGQCRRSWSSESGGLGTRADGQAQRSQTGSGGRGSGGCGRGALPHRIKGQEVGSAAKPSHLESRERTEQEELGRGPGKEKARRRGGANAESRVGKSQTGRGAALLTLSEGVHLEARHFLGQDGLGQVEEGRVVDGEVVVILLQDPHGHALDTVGETREGRERHRQGAQGEGTSGQAGRAGKDRTGTSCFQEAWLRA